VTRLPPQPGERIDRARPVSFTFDGAPATAFAGDTIVSGLYAGGRRTFSRSFKYHRPRGELCGCGQCANSLFHVDGAPGLRGCSERVVDGMVVEHQNAWPSLAFDVMRVTDRIGGPFTPPGFYYKTFIRPRRLWPLYERVLRGAAGLGRLPTTRSTERTWRTEYRRRHCDVLVIGGGIAGLSAALAAARLGADVVLADEDVEPGGALLAEGGHEQVRALAAAARQAGVEILCSAPALGYFDGLVPVWQGDTLHQIRAAQHVAATGVIEQPFVFPDNDLPGVMLAGGARRLAALYAVKPGERAVVATTSDRGLDAALALQAAGVSVAAVADLRADAGGGRLADRVEAAGLRLLRGTTTVRAHGGKAVTAVSLAPVDRTGRADPSRTERVDCDLVAVSAGTAPATSLLLQGGARASYDAASGRFLADALPQGVFAAGAVAGHDAHGEAERSGLVAGLQAALALGLGGATERDAVADGLRELAAAPRPSVATPPAHAHDGRRGGRAFVDLDEDITAKDIAYAADEGYDSIELNKRYSTVTMGPSQGRFSQLAAVRVLAAHTGVDPDAVGLTTARPPWSTVPMGALAGRPFEAAKRSAMHWRAREQGATVKWAGDWRRAYDYGDPAGEALAVHEAAGLIDVSSLGKLLVRGADAGAFLDRLYPNRLSTLAPGRVRYGVLTSDAGRITDDGTICRLDEETFYVTTTSSGAGAVEQWFSWWQAVWQMDVRITDVTQALAAVNLAGPQARAILAGLTDADLSPEGFAYLDGRPATVAGVEALVLRIGFTGELGYEIHAPAVYGEHLWDALMAAGAAAGLRAFGLEPQRQLRLQKLHIIVGQDTDSESTPYGAGMGPLVKLDKEDDFIGRFALTHAADRPLQTALVGFTTTDGHLPTEGAVVLHEGEPAGQVTSARQSAQLGGQVIGMAWVPAALAEDGTRITISDEGATHPADVVTRPFFDPEGAVLRS
jgi:sarcosine oxidase subunit alpha